MSPQKNISRYNISFIGSGKELNETPSKYLSYMLEHKRNMNVLHSAKSNTEEINLYQENGTELILFLSSQMLQVWGKTNKSIDSEVRRIKKLTKNIIKLDEVPSQSI